MTDLSYSPFDNGSGIPIEGKELLWIEWRSNARTELNPYIDSDGKIMRNSISDFSDYSTQCQIEYQEDLKKLPTNLKQELENNTRLLSERMQVEATGRR